MLVYNEKQSVSIEADSNLQEAILTELKDGALIIRTSDNIGRNKSLKVHIKVNRHLKGMYAYNNAKVTSNNLLLIDSLTLFAFDNVDVDLKLNSKMIHINGKKSSKLDLSLLSDEVFIRSEEYCSINATIDTRDIKINTFEKAVLSVSGTTDHLEINALDDATYKGIDFISATAIIKASDNTNIYAHVTEKLELYSNNSSEIHLFSDPEIIIHEFKDKAIIRKKELH